MKKTLFFILFLGITLTTFGQTFYATTDSAYATLVDKAFQYLKAGDCKSCLDKYEESFKISELSILSRLRAASCAYACKNEERWKFHIQFALDKGWGAVDAIIHDLRNKYPELSKYNRDLFYTYTDKQLKDIKKRFGYDESLASELEIIYEDDQALRHKIPNLRTEQERKALWNEIYKVDSINVLKIEQIFLKHGYPGRSKVGDNLSSTAFLVIQHADLAYQEKYFPLIEEAANKGELDKGSLAYLIDRIRIRKGQKQLYGSQVTDIDRDGKWEFSPIEDEINVNERRKDMGLGRIEEYAKQFNIEYKFPKKE
jgi:hypothetical protein